VPCAVFGVCQLQFVVDICLLRCLLFVDVGSGLRARLVSLYSIAAAVQ